MTDATRNLSNQAAVVTGASSGIGKGIALRLASAGARVAVHFHEGREAADRVVADIHRAGGDAIAVQADVRSEQDVLELFAQSIDAFGTLDILVANAGVQRDAAFHDMSLADWNDVLAVNLTGQFLCMRSAVRQFLAQGVREEISASAGKIICISSVHEFIPWPGHVNYAASKGGVAMLMKSAALEYARRKIRVNGIAPGAIKTPINREAWETPEAEQELLKLIPSGRIGVPDEIGRAAAWLASDDADFVQGTMLVVDGGSALYPSFEEGDG